MNNEIKTGATLIEEFFNEIINLEGVDKDTVNKLIELHKTNKFTDKNITNILEDLENK